MRIRAAVCACLLSPLALAEPILQTGESWDGGAIAYPPGNAEVTAQILRLEAGQSAPFHCHPVPTMGYVLKGTAEVETIDGKRMIIGPGDPLVEVMRTVHRGTAVDGEVEIVVFYAGAEGVPTTVRPDEDPEGRYCDS
ncbi:cupin domain-containing protein [Seongchinamella unica]|uniref:Cupin domain-containing protein n=1 Tax=Seongchinamella unica TaxID=2547392 RepID=A0A4R5LSC5_9GAMM|nr:cupin domain-containing protein [Seongchinamella unica]